MYRYKTAIEQHNTINGKQLKECNGAQEVKRSEIPAETDYEKHYKEIRKIIHLLTTKGKAVTYSKLPTKQLLDRFGSMSFIDKRPACFFF